MRQGKRFLAIYLIGIFIGALDANVLGPVFPLLARGLRVSFSWTAWTVTGYTVAYVASTVLAGAWGDRAGRGRIFTLGVAAFGVASALAAVSPNFWVFMIARAIQGAGAGAVYPNAQAEGTRQFPEERKGMALGLFGAVFGVAAIVGPNVGGVLGQFFGWRSIFLFNLPIVALVLGLARRLPASPRGDRPVPDWVGGLSFAGTMALALLGLMVGGGLRWGLWAAAVAAGALFRQRQRVARQPFLNAARLSSPAGLAMMAGAALIGMDMASAVFVPTLAQQELRVSVLGSGLALMPAAFSGAILAGIGGVLVDRIGPRWVLEIGLAAAVVGGVLLAVPHLTLALFIVAMVAFGLATAFTMGAPLNRMALYLYGEHQSGEALSMVAVFRSVGLAAGPVLLVLGQSVKGFTGMFGVVALASLVALVVFLAVPATGALASAGADS